MTHKCCFTALLPQVAACNPILGTLAPQSRICFYCHFPDMLLAPRTSAVKELYRFFFDLFEKMTTATADVVLANSRFTSRVIRKTFTGVHAVDPQVLYPCVNIRPNPLPWPTESNPTRVVFLSINRYERKKEIDLALKAFGRLLQMMNDETHPASLKTIELVIAGGYDERLRENREVYSELKAAAEVGLLLLLYTCLGVPSCASTGP